MCQLAGIHHSHFDWYFRRALEKLNCSPEDVPLIAKTIKVMARRDKLKLPDES
jgi:hypothetical protein